MSSNEGGWGEDDTKIFTCSNRSGGQKAAWKAEVDADDVKRQAGADVSPKCPDLCTDMPASCVVAGVAGC